MVRMNEILLTALPRVGQGGNFTPAQLPFSETAEGQAAKHIYDERIRNGVMPDQVTADDKSEFLAQVQIESVYMQYCDNLKGFLENADKKSSVEMGRPLAEMLPESEVETSTTTTPPRKVPKGPDGGGYVVQVSGFTMHKDGFAFLTNVLLQNFRRINEPNGFADQTLNVRDEKGQPVRDEKGQLVNKLAMYLPGVIDPLKGRVSHVFFYLSKQVENPQPKTYVYITQDYIGPLIPPLTLEGESGIAQNAGVAVDASAAASGTAPTPTATPSNPRWTPFGPSANTNAPAVAPTDPAASGTTPTTPAKKKYRYEFVLVFIWRDAASATPAAPTPPGAPTPPVTPGK
jgi:hypothetical protein